MDVVDLDAALGEQFLNIAVGQSEAQVSTHREHDHVGWEAKAGEGGVWKGAGRDWRVLMLAVSLSWRVARMHACLSHTVVEPADAR